MSLVGSVWKSRERCTDRRVEVVEDDGCPNGFVAVIGIDEQGDRLPGSKRSRIRKAGVDQIPRYKRVEKVLVLAEEQS